MDLRTGKIYESKEEGLKDNIPESDLFQIPQKPKFEFSKGSFKENKEKVSK